MTDEVCISTKEDGVFQRAELVTLRQITRNLELIANEMLAHRKDMTTMQVDLAIIKERQTQSQELKEKLNIFEEKIDVLERRNDNHDGAYTFVTMLKDFGPWALSLIVLGWSLLSRTHP